MMAAIGIPARSSGDWDVPATQVAADMQELERKRRADVLREAIAHEVELHDDYEVSALAGSLYLVTHPDTRVSTDADYPNWTPGSPA